MPKKYEHLEIIKEFYGLPLEINVKYDDGTTENIKTKDGEVTSDEISHILYEFAKQEGYVSELGMVDLGRFLKSDNVTKILSEKETPVEEHHEVEEHLHDKTPEEDLKSKEKNSKKETKDKKNRWNIKRIGAWFLAIITAGGLTYGGIQIGKKIAEKANRNNHFIQMVDTPIYDNLSYEEKLALLKENSETVDNGLVNMVNGKLESSKDLDQCIENLANISLANMTEISDYITGHTSNADGNVETKDLRFLFDEKTIDFCAVDYFNDLRDNIINAAYTTKSISQTKTCVTKFNEEFVNFVFGGKPLPYNMNGNIVYYTFESLNPSAQMTILTMGITVLNIEHDFTVNVAGEEYNRMVALAEACELNTTVYQELLETQKFTKTK